MNSKSLIIIAAATVGLVGIAAIVAVNRSATVTRGSGGPSNASPVFSGLKDKLDTVSRIIIKRGTQEAVLVRDASGKNWSVENKGGYPASFDSIRPVVAAVAEATIIDEKTAKPELFDRLEVDDPTKENAKGTLITLQDEQGVSLASLIVGKADGGGASADPFSGPAPGDGVPKRFARRANENQSYLIAADLTLDPNPLAFTNKTAINIANDKIRSLTINSPLTEGGTPAEVVTITRPDPKESKFTVENQPTGRALKDEFAAGRVAQSLSFVNFDDVRSADGFDWASKDATTGTFTLFDGTQINYTVVEKDGTNWVKFASVFNPAPIVAPPLTTPEASSPAVPTQASPPAANATADVTQPTQAPPTLSPTTLTPPAAGTTAEVPKVDEVLRVAEAVKAQQLIQEALKAESDKNNSNWRKWAFALPESKVTQFKTRIVDLLAPPPADAASDGGAAPGLPPMPDMNPALPQGVPTAPSPDPEPGPLSPE